MSTLKTNTLSNVAGTASTAIENAINGSAKAWVNFNGTGTVAIRASYNVTSITDNGTGDYTANFTNSFADTNYTVSGSAGLSTATSWGTIVAPAQGGSPFSGFKTTSAIRFITTNFAAAYDTSEACIVFHR